jgi:hypothetical protein
MKKLPDSMNHSRRSSSDMSSELRHPLELVLARGGMVTGGLAVTVYSPPMTRNRPEFAGFYRGFGAVNPVVAQ